MYEQKSNSDSSLPHSRRAFLGAVATASAAFVPALAHPTTLEQLEEPDRVDRRSAILWKDNAACWHAFQDITKPSDLLAHVGTVSGSKKLWAHCTPEVAAHLNQVHGVNVEAELTAVVAQEIAAEMTNQLPGRRYQCQHCGIRLSVVAMYDPAESPSPRD